MNLHLLVKPFFAYPDDFWSTDPMVRAAMLLNDKTSPKRKLHKALCVVAALTLSTEAVKAAPQKVAPLLTDPRVAASRLADFTSLDVSGALTLVPSLADFATNHMTVSGALRMTLYAKETTGVQIFVSKASGNQRLPGDLQVRVSGTPTFITPGNLPTLLTYVPGESPTGKTFALDAKVTNLRQFVGEGRGKRAVYSELLVFTVVPD